MFVQVKSLPDCLRNALSDCGYFKEDVEVNSQETVSVNPNTSFEGNRGFATVVNLATGERVNFLGSWGGANPFEKQTIDNENKEHALVQNMAIVKGESGGRGTFARIYVAPFTIAPWLTASAATLSVAQGVVLHCLKAYKSSYRKGEAQSYGVNAAAYDAIVIELAALGYAKVSSNGATQITTNGKNALNGFKLPKCVW